CFSVVYRSSPSTNSRNGRKGSPGLIERISNAFGLLGVVRFLEGYYLIVVTKANIIANFGYHSIYKIAEVAMISIAMDGLSTSTEEQRYSVDLSTDFYFSYTYDLSRSLQENILSADWEKDGERQQLIDLPFTKLSLTLIGRRSSQYAGTRYLKRGANLLGNVANDVETEQVLWDVSSSPNFRLGRFSSFVQRRGSVPLRDLRAKYGNPIIVMNLVKRREKRRHEGLLHDQFLKAINYLNQFLPPSEHIAYMSFDVARCNKMSTVTSNVLTKMEEIAFKAVQAHGWFQLICSLQTFPIPYTRYMDHRSALPDFKP
ncbi:hypothetical protein OESDEN_15972, partial [Oesophagostomum dentatum]